MPPRLNRLTFLRLALILLSSLGVDIIAYGVFRYRVVVSLGAEAVRLYAMMAMCEIFIVCGSRIVPSVKM